MNFIAGLIILITSFLIMDGVHDLANYLWLLFGIAIITRDQIKQLIIYFWEEHARK